MARAFVAKAALGIPTTSSVIERLPVDKSLHGVCGWERRRDRLRPDRGDGDGPRRVEKITLN